MTTAACGLRSPLTVPQHYSYSTLQHSVVSELTKHTNLVICIAQSIYFLYNYVPSVIWWLVGVVVTVLVTSTKLNYVEPH